MPVNPTASPHSHPHTHSPTHPLTHSPTHPLVTHARLWISYNLVDSLKGVEALRNLRVLYASNNMISSWDEIDRLAHLEHLNDVLFIGNPLHTKYHTAGTSPSAPLPTSTLYPHHPTAPSRRQARTQRETTPTAPPPTFARCASA